MSGVDRPLCLLERQHRESTKHVTYYSDQPVWHGGGAGFSLGESVYQLSLGPLARKRWMILKNMKHIVTSTIIHHREARQRALRRNSNHTALSFRALAAPTNTVVGQHRENTEWALRPAERDRDGGHSTALLPPAGVRPASGPRAAGSTHPVRSTVSRIDVTPASPANDPAEDTAADAELLRQSGEGDAASPVPPTDIHDLLLPQRRTEATSRGSMSRNVAPAANEHVRRIAACASAAQVGDDLAGSDLSAGQFPGDAVGLEALPGSNANTVAAGLRAEPGPAVVLRAHGDGQPERVVAATGAAGPCRSGSCQGMQGLELSTRHHIVPVRQSRRGRQPDLQEVRDTRRSPEARRRPHAGRREEEDEHAER